MHHAELLRNAPLLHGYLTITKHFCLLSVVHHPPPPQPTETN